MVWKFTVVVVSMMNSLQGIQTLFETNHWYLMYCIYPVRGVCHVSYLEAYVEVLKSN